MKLNFPSIKLEKPLATLSLAVVGAVFGAAAQAQTVTFSGNLRGATCTPSVSGNLVTLPDAILGTDLVGSNSSAKETPFTVSLTGCGTAGSGLKGKIYFWQTNASGGRLVKTAGAGNGWQYELLYGTSGNTLLAVGNSAAVLQNASDPGVNMTTAQTYSVPYRVRYYRPGSAALTPGNMTAQATMVFYTM